MTCAAVVEKTTFENGFLELKHLNSFGQVLTEHVVEGISFDVLDLLALLVVGLHSVLNIFGHFECPHHLLQHVLLLSLLALLLVELLEHE